MTSADLSIREAGEEDAARWDAYVETAPAATFFHLFGWRRVIARAYGHGAVYLMAERAGRIAGILPLIDVKSPIFGRNLISTAFTVGGGIVAGDSETQRALGEAAIEAGRRRRVSYVELRSQSAALDGWNVKDAVYAGFERALPACEDENLKAIPRKRRAEVRKAIDALNAGDLAYEFTGELGAFYSLYAHAMRDHGTPIFPRRFAVELMKEFGERVEMLQIRSGEEPVLALLSFYFRDRVMPYYFGAGPRSRECRAFDLSIWLQMRRGVERGAPLFDFGRSKYGTGSFDFKSYWGFEAKPLEYQYALINARETPNVSPTNPKFSAATAVWRKLPLPVANVAGPILARHIA